MKNKIQYHSYYEGNTKYMTCETCGNYERVGDSAIKVKCSKCVSMVMRNQYPVEPPKQYVPTGRPAGWHWMAEFVDKDGNVFHRGKEQPKLKGTLPPTKVSPPKKKAKRRTKEQILVDKYKQKQKLKRELKKQQDFLNHKIDKG